MTDHHPCSFKSTALAIYKGDYIINIVLLMFNDLIQLKIIIYMMVLEAVM